MTMNNKPNTYPRSARYTTAALATAAALAATAFAGPALAADPVADLDIDVNLKRSHLERSLDAAEARSGYEKLYRKADKLDVAPKKKATDVRIKPADLEKKMQGLRAEVKEARKAAAEPKVASPDSLGVSQGTLESIAACESGGDPTATSADGTYRGKYQFDYGTWASMGGSGDPAAASVAEQDYRAAMLYAQSGSSPWPVCGS